MADTLGTSDGRALVIGIGQELRGDDALGRRVAEAFQAAYPDLADVVSLVQLVPELAERISVATSVVFVDACEGAEPGRVSIRSVQTQSSPSVSHATLPEDLLACARTLFGTCPPAVVVTVTGASFDMTEKLSPTVERAIPEASKAIRDWLLQQEAG